MKKISLLFTLLILVLAGNAQTNVKSLAEIKKYKDSVQNAIVLQQKIDDIIANPGKYKAMQDMYKKDVATRDSIMKQYAELEKTNSKKEQDVRNAELAKLQQLQNERDAKLQIMKDSINKAIGVKQENKTAKVSTNIPVVNEETIYTGIIDKPMETPKDKSPISFDGQWTLNQMREATGLRAGAVEKYNQAIMAKFLDKQSCLITHRNQPLANAYSLCITLRGNKKIEANWNNQIRTTGTFFAGSNALHAEPLDFHEEVINNEQPITDWSTIEYMLPIAKNILAVYDASGAELFTLQIPN